MCDGVRAPSSLPLRTTAEPGIISEYILTMLTHDRPEAELRKFCIEELAAFLEGGA